MNIFVISSWYPSSVNELNGIFVRDQIDAISSADDDYKFFVSVWGHESSNIRFRTLSSIINPILWFFKQREHVVYRSSRYIELHSPTITASLRIPCLTLKHLIDHNRKVLRKAIVVAGKIDLIHAHVSFPAGYIAYLLAQEFSIPYIITEHMGPFPGVYAHNEILDQRIRVALMNASSVIAVSNFLKGNISKYINREIDVIPNLVDEVEFSPHENLGSKFKFFTLCGMDKIKGIDILLQAIAEWRPNPEDVTFCIGGDGPELPALQKLANSLGISNLITWIGKINRDEASGYFKSAHAFVMSSRQETFGVVYAEAIACGKPIIATRCGGPEDIVNICNGMLVDINPSSLSIGLKSVYDNWVNYDPVVIRNDFMNRFSSAAVAKKLKSVYKKAVI